jgi:hypothetical protein
VALLIIHFFIYRLTTIWARPKTFKTDKFYS